MAELDPARQRAVNRWLLLLVAGAFALLIYLLQPILSPFVLGALIAYLGDPMVDLLERWRLNRTLGVVLVFLVLASLVSGAMFFAIPVLAQQLDAMIEKIPAIYQWLTQVGLPWVEERFGLPVGELPRVDWSGQLADNWQSLGRMTAETVGKIEGATAVALIREGETIIPRGNTLILAGDRLLAVVQAGDDVGADEVREAPQNRVVVVPEAVAGGIADGVVGDGDGQRDLLARDERPTAKWSRCRRHLRRTSPGVDDEPDSRTLRVGAGSLGFPYLDRSVADRRHGA